MTGIEDLNRPAFHRAARRLRAAGHDVTNPADLPEGWTWERYMQRGLSDLVQCEGLALLNGAWGSKGARIEIRLALILDKEIRSVAEWCVR